MSSDTPEMSRADSRRLVPLVEKLSSQEATIIVSRLRAAEIEAHVRSAGMSAIQPGVFADVVVRQRDFKAAKDLLAAPAVPVDEGVISLTDARVEKTLNARPPARQPEDAVFCHNCGSGDTIALEGRIPTMLPFYRMKVSAEDRWYRCQSCGAQFQDKLDRSQGFIMGVIWALTLGAVTLFGLIYLPRIF